MTALPVLDLGDDPFERGLAHGRAMREHIHDNLEVYLQRFEAGGVDRRRAAAEGIAWAAFIKKDNPEYFLEMEGLAEAARLDISGVAILNARYEITYSCISREALQVGDPREPDGCTSFGLLPQATATGRTIIGQNWDWLARVEGRTLITRVRRRDKPDFIGFTEAGIVGCKMSVNQYGIGMCINGLVTALDGKHEYRKPVHVRCRELADADRLDKALLPWLQSDRVCSSNVLVGQGGGGEIIDIEVTPDEAHCLYPDEAGIITHANHLVHPRSPVSALERIAPSTLYRDRRTRRAFSAASGRLDIPQIKAVMSDHFAFPMAVCRHEDSEIPLARRMTTVALVVLDLDTLELHATAGAPCAHSLERYPLYPENPPA